jgi:uncharacterized protein YidB (DUF937 family)
MGLLDQLAGGLSPGATGEHSGLAGAVASLLANRQTGGVGGLADRFNAAGLGHIMQSWIGTGQNREIAPGDLHRAIGDDQLQAMAAQSGMSVPQLLPLLAQFLPTIIDHLTPHGQVPDQGALHGRLAEALGGFHL